VLYLSLHLQGIPYAVAPVGKLRWRETIPLSDDTTNCPSELDANRYGSKCVQLDSDSMPTGSEDCLFVNVWTPAGLDGSSHLNVMVHIHDGGLMTGSGHEPCKFSLACLVWNVLIIAGLALSLLRIIFSHFLLYEIIFTVVVFASFSFLIIFIFKSCFIVTVISD